MISLKSDRAGLYITGMIGSNHFLGKFSTNSILILLIMVLAIGCDMILYIIFTVRSTGPWII